MENKKNLSRAQEKAKSFMEEYQVEKIISEMLNSLVHSRDPKPVIFMIKYLASLVTEQELDENGIVVTGPMPQRIPIITFPKFDQNCNSLLKKHLTREIWTNMKKRSTSKGGNIQLCVKSGVQKPQYPVGIMASDEEAYKVFADIFQPIVQDLHPEYDYRFAYQVEELKFEIIQEQLDNMSNFIQRVTDFKLEVNRNFRGTPFTPLMTKESKLQVERKVVEVLGEVCGTYSQVHKLNDLDKNWLKSIGIDPNNENEEFDAAGINDDWPIGRGVFIEDSKSFVVLVNYMDHLKIVVLKDKTDINDNIGGGFERMLKLIKKFEKFDYAKDPFLGNITVSPTQMGTAMTLHCEITLPPSKVELDREILIRLKHDSQIEYQKVDKQLHKMKTLKTLAASYNEMLQITDFMKQIKTVCQYYEKRKENMSDLKKGSEDEI